MKCQLCSREAVADLCVHHGHARETVESAYLLWNEAYGTLDRVEYLRRVAKNPETGQWASEVANWMLSRTGQSQ